MRQDVKHMIDQLTRDELREVREYVSLMLSQGGASTPARERVRTNDEDFARIALDCIVRVMRARGADVRSVSVLERSQMHASFVRKFVGEEDEEGLVAYFRRIIRRNKIERTAFMHVAINCLYDELIEMDKTVSATTMMAQIHRLPAVVNRCFPGYARSGLLRLVVTNKTGAENVRS